MANEEFPGQRAALREMRHIERNARLDAKKEKAAAKALRAALADAVEAERQRTRQDRRLATRAKNERRAFRAKSILLRRQLRLERLLRLALR